MRLALVALLLANACITAPPLKPPSEWAAVAYDVDLVVEDPARDALYVRTGGFMQALAQPDAEGNFPVAPPIGRIPNGAQALVTVAGSVWWRAQGDVGKPPPFESLDGVLLETPLIGPGKGQPRPLFVSGQREPEGGPADAERPANHAIPDDALVNVRGIYALAASSLGLTVIDLEGGEVRTFKRAGLVRPAISSDGRYGAAYMGLGPRPGVKETRTGEVPLVGVFEGPKPLAVYELQNAPDALYFGAGALYAKIGRTLFRHDLEHPQKARTTTREEAILRHRDGMVVAMEEALEAGDVARAVDAVDVLEADGLLETIGIEGKRVVEEVRAEARPLFEAAVAKAERDGRGDLARVLNERMRLIDGRVARDVKVSASTLAIAVQPDEWSAISEADLAAFFRARPALSRVSGCGAASTADACLDLRVGASTRREPCPSGAFCDGLPGLRDVAAGILAKRADCLGDGDVLLDETEGAPVSRFSCDSQDRIKAGRFFNAALVLSRHSGTRELAFFRAHLTTASATSPEVVFLSTSTQLASAVATALVGTSGEAPFAGALPNRAIVWWLDAGAPVSESYGGRTAESAVRGAIAGDATAHRQGRAFTASPPPPNP
jgi:hypothetical protein